ncbi:MULTISPECIES: DNA-processing protein DprA [Exiguobacterium]|uniref:DNA protecting protein DprA n=1 Tax=Exiguobacterium sibiricum (strain DSM 17290 / CCUG 55495 / CIP 109462 / JCM 13490 / 255-15) TaxID=262543 RepID=B1YIL5_EXIS2|nr:MULTISPECIES: DNA-processing protein DprA [Exiguobacterium]ACB61341.1 DNA protecting protein DprA [Exiguobacterium sibiricum 255-15]MCT4791094.1 DNA-processing protein DprA [Exiguobacterium artemiae]MDW2884928.1 DNA-processing protein DprA [Exiguobacterium sibiricum]HCN58082.1 DNA-protecting protein DprA [Exiguobacterium sp.]
MERELYARFATCRVPYSIVVLIEQYGLLPVEDLPVSRSIKNRYQQALQLDQVPTNLLVPGDPYFPMPLLQIPQPVYGLFFSGDPSLLRQPMISIIGSRQPSPSHSKRLSFLRPFFESPFVTVSGGALGIDSLVHRLSLKHHQATIAVLASGFDFLYPARHAPLFQRIQQDGLLLSEYPAPTPVKKHQFLERNRIISGLASGLIIVEATRKSGTMNTAGHALEQGKDVYCIPGCPTEKHFQGTNQLIAEGAIPLLNPEEVSKSILMNVDKWESRLL